MYTGKRSCRDGRIRSEGAPSRTNSMNRRIYRDLPRRDTRGLFSSPEIRLPFCKLLFFLRRLLPPLPSPSLSLSLSLSLSFYTLSQFPRSVRKPLHLDDRNYIRSRPATGKYVPRSERDERQKRVSPAIIRVYERETKR